MSQRSEKLRRQMAVLREDVDEMKQRQAAAEQFFAALHSVTSQADRHTAVLLAEERKKTRRSEREARSWRLNAYLTLVLLVLTACVFLAVNVKADRAPVELAEEGWLPVVQHIQETDEQRSGARQSGLFDDADRLALARMVWGEARGCSTTEQAAVVWCVLNRFDSSEAYYADCMTICDIVTQESQFEGYNPSFPVEADILALVDDVLERWMVERVCGVNMGRVLPADYLFFTGDGTENVFTTEWRGGETWDWSLDSPYE